ncbi:MAG: hypothetical protein COS82_09390 [Zetaproteobacteria bacterium CG06_land_8_20_14_3_00_59_53]|nr:MAG: hypothetical protein AUK36_09900 [Zetaproteobacteria bacterium CG2_30_59_37]PIO90756.1 MAG: hypothetical protein COX56_01060 [Zetaproteobacteria bacterium CG23_combo_of_CG06-09_8_20_14_all_59_86]PIQ65328.1 MAG: hypothetical protein COV97_04660 [Zetaproteobacteria bacterium CG11_big_fil_rev_8_21_14_0_20_59_439]PIU69870.1 MAG: hypothetical protein COS82_09390 [Zetaproteobacteria bacterium CG06_land_8_20_14_3_00_59_53]PIU97396.1 MAG: hypothetical protein COS62_04100 [Zetaproteobacteria bac
MKIRTGQLTGPQQGASTSRVSSTDGRFQVLLDHELKDAVEKQSDSTPSGRGDKEHPYRLIGDATRLLDDAIAQIESSDTPNDKTIESLQLLRNELSHLGQGEHDLKEAGIILSVETERLKSW